MVSLLLALITATEPLPVVAIDAGHGGEQTGAIGVCGAREKDIALVVARELAKLLDASGRVRSILIRPDDRDVPLEERARIANDAGAALFVSVHANASPNSDSRGVETYFLSKRAANRRIADVVERENRDSGRQSSTAEENVAQIVADLLLNASHVESQRLAVRLQEGISSELDTGGRGVLQAPFIVLLGAHMPAALVEVGFLTHEEECVQLAETAYQRAIAKTLAASILEHIATEPPAVARR